MRCNLGIYKISYQCIQAKRTIKLRVKGHEGHVKQQNIKSTVTQHSRTCKHRLIWQFFFSKVSFNFQSGLLRSLSHH